MSVAATLFPRASSPQYTRLGRGALFRACCPSTPNPGFRRACSATRPLLDVLRITCALYLDLRRGAVDRAELVGRQLDVGCSEVLLEAVQLRGARNRHDPRLLREQPRERDL